MDIKGTVVVSLLKILGLLPLPVVTRIGAVLGWLGWYLTPELRRITLINLEICFPEIPSQERLKLARTSVIETMMSRGLIASRAG